MKRNKIALPGVVLLGAASLVLAGCASGGGESNGTEEPAEGSSTAVITTNGSEPQNPLIPTNTNETGGGKVVDSIFAGLISYNADGSVVNDVAEDITVGPDGAPRLGRLASYVRDRRIPLEVCPRSNVQTGAAPSIAEHPIGLLSTLGFRVTVNTDNRLMSRTSMSTELTGLVDAFGYDLAMLEKLTVNAMKSAFLPYDERVEIIHRIKRGYAELRGEDQPA